MRSGPRAASSTRLPSDSSWGQAMTVDDYALLTKAVAGKDTLGRDKVYKGAYDLITKSHLNRDVAASHVAALEAAIRRIEDEVAVEEGRDAAQINEVLSDGPNWKPW